MEKFYVDDYYDIIKYEDCHLYYLEYYYQGRDYMPIHRYSSRNLNEVYKKYYELVGMEVR